MWDVLEYFLFALDTNLQDISNHRISFVALAFARLPYLTLAVFQECILYSADKGAAPMVSFSLLKSSWAEAEEVTFYSAYFSARYSNTFRRSSPLSALL